MNMQGTRLKSRPEAVEVLAVPRAEASRIGRALGALTATRRDAASSVLRVTLGLVMFPHGAQKMLGWFGGYGFDATVAGLSQMGIAPALVVLVILAEFFGSIALILGALARPAAVGIIAVMLGAIATVHLPNGFFMNWTGAQAGEGFEYHLLAIGIALAIVIRGAGAFSVDRLISRRTPRD